MRTKLLAAWLVLSIPAATIGAAPETTTAAPAKPSEPSKTLFPPISATQLAVGTGLAFAASVPFDKKIREHLFPYRNNTPAKNLRHFGDIGQVAGPIIGTGFLIEGFAADDQKSKDTAVLSYESFLVAGAASAVIKFAVGRKRPSKTSEPFSFHPAGGDASFPSGHTTTAFAAATVFSEQYPHWYVIVPAYGAAGAVGFSRIYANQHWLSDVVGGAILGTVVTHLLCSRFRHSRSETAWHLEPDPNGLRLVRSFGGN